ncbi:MAG: flagellar hook-basal body complex protein FliE [Alphaproteobacteria bacterium]
MPIGKMIDPAAAASAYANTTRIGSAAKAEGDDGVNFSDFLKQGVSATVDALKSSEAASAQAVSGAADITDVVQAVTAAELTLQTVVAVRDRLVSAYQEIMRMPI